jgi:hypothetical protein
MDPALPALDLVTIIGAGLLGVIWTLARRYWHALILLASLGIVRGLLGDELMTEFQRFWVFIAIGVVGLVFVVSLTARALANDRRIKAVLAGSAAQLPVRPMPAPEIYQTAVPAAPAPASAPAPAAEEPAPAPAATAQAPGKRGRQTSEPGDQS